LWTGTTLSIPDEMMSKPVMADVKPDLSSSVTEQLSDVTNTSSVVSELDDGTSTPKAPVAKKGENWWLNEAC